MTSFAEISLLAVFTVPLSLSAATLTGTVINQTTKLPASGDTAVLLDLTQTMQESARTTIDALGRFSFTVPDLTGMRVVRVEHQRADYYVPVPPNTPRVNLDVYDVAEAVAGVSVYADVNRVQTGSSGLNVTEQFTVRNESKPPRTQFSDHAFDFFLPAGAVIEGGATTGPGGMTVRNMPVSLRDKNHYAFVFPLRPGETHLEVSYQLPYSGKLEIHPAIATPTDNLAVTLPASMEFTGSAFQPFHGNSDQPGTMTYLATNVQPGTPLVFRVSGSGTLPPQPQGNEPPGGGVGMAAAQGNPPGGGLGPPIDSPDPLNKYKWWLLSATALAFVMVAAFTLRNRPGIASVPPPGALSQETMPSPLSSPLPAGVRATALRAQMAAPEKRSSEPPPDIQRATPSLMPVPVARHNPMMLDIKEELFAVETERLEGQLTQEDAAQLKSALEVLMRRVLRRRSMGA